MMNETQVYQASFHPSAPMVFHVVFESVVQTSTADATAGREDILSGKTAYIATGKVTGTMANNGATGGDISTVAGTITIPAGYTSGGTAQISSTEQAKIITDNIKKGVTILGVSGKSTVVDVSDETVTPAYVREDKNFYNSNGNLVSGTMPNNGSATINISDLTAVNLSAGYYSNSAKAQISSTESAKVIATNIKSGVTILGVAGSVIDASTIPIAEGEDF